MRRAGVVVMLGLASCRGAESAKDTPATVGTAAAPAARAAGDSLVSSRPALAPGDSATAASRLTVLFIGTSLTAGLGLDPDHAYPALLQQRADSARLPVRVVNAGLSGETSAGALRRVDWLLREPADLVAIETGANDGLRGLEVDSTRENLRRIVRKVRRMRPGATVLLMQMEAPPNFGVEYTTRFREMFPAVAREEGAILVPFLLDGVAAVRDMNQGDGIHPNDRGARRVADNVWRTLAPILERLVRAR
jgi:acyl-CoA thioesterase-1